MINSLCSCTRGTVVETTCRRQMSNGSILAEEIFFYFSTKKYLEINTFFFLKKYFLRMKENGIFLYLLYPNVYAERIQRNKYLS